MSFLAVPLSGWIQIAVFFGVLTLAIKPLGLYIAAVMEGKRVFLSPVLAPIEKAFYWLCRIDPTADMNAWAYTKNLLALTFGGITWLFILLILQPYPDISADLALNTAISFVTNTDWQSYVPETTMTATSQMVGLTIQNFLSAAMGLSVLMALVRGFTRRESLGLGNFWADMTRGVLYILLPLALLWSFFLLWQGSAQTFGEIVKFIPLEGGDSQTVMTGPVASMMGIKEIGTNGGSYYTPSAAHPFENPTPLSNFLQLLAVFLIPSALTYSFGAMAKDTRQGWAIFITMLMVLLPLILFCMAIEHAGHPALSVWGIDQTLGHMEGKELRFGTLDTAFWTAVNGGSSSGSSTSSFDSLMPLSSLVPLALIQIGQVIFGGVGSGLYGLLVYILLTVFVTSLMAGHAPIFLEKRIGVTEIKFACLAVLIPATLTLGGTALSVLLEEGQKAAVHPHAQGFSQILYAVASASNNNGSAFPAFIGNTVFYNLLLGFCMFASRFGVIGCVLVIAGKMASKNKTPQAARYLDTASPLFILSVIFVVLILSVPAFLPSLALGPISEYFHLLLSSAPP